MSAMTDPSSRARVLLSHARRQFVALGAELDQWGARDDTMSVRIEASAFGGRQRFRVTAITPPPAEFEFALFDAIGNVVKCLDRTIALLAEKAGHDAQAWRGEFPIAIDRSGYFASAPDRTHPRDRSLGDIEERAVRVVDKVQPFLTAKPRDHALALLQRWARYDKHRLGHPALVVARGAAAIIRDDKKHVIEVFDLWNAMNEIDRRQRLTVGIDALDLLPENAVKPWLGYLSSPPKAEASIAVVLRTAVAFGAQSDLYPDVRAAIDWAESEVLEPLWRILDE